MMRHMNPLAAFQSELEENPATIINFIFLQALSVFYIEDVPPMKFPTCRTLETTQDHPPEAPSWETTRTVTFGRPFVTLP